VWSVSRIDRPTSLRSTQFSFLVELALRTGNPPALSELADAMVSDRSSVGHALRPLVRDGCVTLHRKEADRRAQDIMLTDRGRAKFREGVKLWQAAQDTVVSLYGRNWPDAFRSTVLQIAHDGRPNKITRESAQ
jgi:DNA-binding MarR family transcriptional regulator